jgi:DNA-binding NarL/FixJ family response regulator
MPEYKFLVVEDSPTMRQLISFALKRIPGSKIVEANDGIDALKKLSTQKFDIILTDINMPIMDGPQTHPDGGPLERRERDPGKQINTAGQTEAKQRTGDHAVSRLFCSSPLPAP